MCQCVCVHTSTYICTYQTHAHHFIICIYSHTKHIHTILESEAVSDSYLMIGNAFNVIFIHPDKKYKLFTWSHHMSRLWTKRGKQACPLRFLSLFRRGDLLSVGIIMPCCKACGDLWHSRIRTVFWLTAKRKCEAQIEFSRQPRAQQEVWQCFKKNKKIKSSASKSLG